MAPGLCDPQGTALPPALSLEEWRSDVIPERPIYVLGYPGKPMPGTERFSLLRDLIRCEYGVKRFSLGEISHPRGCNCNETDFGHDCTTLGGSSGSQVIDLGDGSASVVGIHFARSIRISNFAHSMASLQNGFISKKLKFV